MTFPRLSPALFDVIERIGHDIENCLRDHGGTLAVSLEPLMGALAKQALQLGAMPRGARSAAALAQAEEATRVAFVEYYFDETRRNARMFGECIRPLQGETLDADRCSTQFPARVTVGAASSKLDQALAQAQANLQAAASAQSALFVLCGLALPRQRLDDSHLPLKTLFEAAREVLFQRMHQFEATHLRLALIKGCPQQLQALRESMASRYYGPGKAVEHLLTPGERLPGRVDSARVDALRDEIAQAVAQPLRHA